MAGLPDSQNIQAVFAANEALLSVVLAYADAQFNLTGNGSPFGPLHDCAGEDDEEDGDEGVAGSEISVLSKRDFVLTDEDAVLAAGRLAYVELWPEHSPSAASEEVTHIGCALYQYAHLNGWDKVQEMPVVVPTGATTVIQAHEDLLRGDPDNWPENPFIVEAPVIYLQSDAYG